MAERRTNRSSERSTAGSRGLFTVVGLSLLAIPGFAVGLAAGIAWEDPGLLFGHLMGRGEDVVIHESDDGQQVARESAPAMPDVAAPPAPAPVPATPEPEATRVRDEVVAPVKPVATSARFAVQVGAFADNRGAERLADDLKAKGFHAYVTPAAKVGQARWRVRVGPFSRREDAEQAAGRLKSGEKLPTWVLDENAAG
jgi:cell division septation protein DedD